MIQFALNELAPFYVVMRNSEGNWDVLCGGRSKDADRMKGLTVVSQVYMYTGIYSPETMHYLPVWIEVP